MSLVKKLLLFLLLLFFFLVINTNLSFKLDVNFYQAVIFTLAGETLFIWPNLKIIFIAASLVLFAVMISFFILGMEFIGLANFFGSLAYGIFIISALFYLPKLFKDGSIS